MKSIFKVGDEVWCMLYGKGKVTELDDDVFCIGVEFEEGDDVYEWYTSDGRLQLEYPPTLGFEKVEMPKPNQIRYRWRAKTCDSYYYIDASGDIKTRKETKDCWDNDLFKVGNYFKTIEEARESKIYMSFIREEE